VETSYLKIHTCKSESSQRAIGVGKIFSRGGPIVDFSRGSLNVVLNVRFTMNGKCAKKKTIYIYSISHEQAIIE